MTHAECQDLLLDLAYGELDAARAAEVEEHLAGCADCRREKALLDEARTAAAPLRELEAPPPALDEPILAAAKAQAQLDHDGDIGEVIEVQGEVKPLGVEAARIDALAKPPVRHEARRPRWALRVALGGSVAGAAALALVLSTSLQSRREAEQAARAAAEKDFEIRVQAPQQASPAPQKAPEVPQQAPEARHDAEQEKVAERAVQAPAQVVPAATPPRQKRPAPSGTVARETAAKKEASAPTADTAGPAAPHEDEAPAASGAASPPARAAQQEMRGVAAPPPAAARVAPVENASDLERAARDARHAGEYLRAASLYRQASSARRAGAPSDGAWDLAHAVECLAAVGQFDDARKLRAELSQLYPSEATALAAAGRALRSADVVSSPAK